MYGVDTKTSEGGARFITPQKPEVPGLSLQAVSWGPSGKDADKAEALMFDFVRNDGAAYRLYIFPVDEARVQESVGKGWYTYNSGPKKGQSMSVKDAVAMEYEDFQRKVVHIMRAFMSADKAVIPPTNSFETFANAVVGLLKPYALGGPKEAKNLRMKLVYDKKGYVTIPRYNHFLYAENDPRQFQWTSYDKTTPPEPDPEPAAAEEDTAAWDSGEAI